MGEPKSKIPTFFSVFEKSFSDLDFSENYGIAVPDFVSACKSIVPIFDKLGVTAFAPAKKDFIGNIKKINKKYSTDSSKFTTLQKIVLYEVEKKEHKHKNSATVATLWIQRGLEFIRKLLLEIMTGEPDLVRCVQIAYDNTLKKFHGWMVQGIFTLAIKAVPSRGKFLSMLAVTECDTNSADFYHSLQEDIEIYLKSLDKIIHVIGEFLNSFHEPIGVTI